MSTAKEVFQSNKELTKWWVSVTHDNRFDLVAVHARAQVAELRLTQEQAIGADLMMNLLANLPESEDRAMTFPNPGLHHQAEKIGEKPNPTK